MSKINLQCDECGDSFEVDYDGETETPDDAAWFHSCLFCGLVLCGKCEKTHTNNGDVCRRPRKPTVGNPFLTPSLREMLKETQKEVVITPIGRKLL